MIFASNTLVVIALAWSWDGFALARDESFPPQVTIESGTPAMPEHAPVPKITIAQKVSVTNQAASIPSVAPASGDGIYPLVPSPPPDISTELPESKWWPSRDYPDYEMFGYKRPDGLIEVERWRRIKTTVYQSESPIAECVNGQCGTNQRRGIFGLFKQSR